MCLFKAGAMFFSVFFIHQSPQLHLIKQWNLYRQSVPTNGTGPPWEPHKLTEKACSKEWGRTLGKAQKTEQREQFHQRPAWQASKFVWVVYRIVGDSKASLRNAPELWGWLRSSISGTLLGTCRQLDKPEEFFSPAVPKACITMGCTLWISDVAGTSWDLQVIFEPSNLVCFPSFNKPPSRRRAKMGYFISEKLPQDTGMAKQDKSATARSQEHRAPPVKWHVGFLPHNLHTLSKPIQLCG